MDNIKEVIGCQRMDEVLQRDEDPTVLRAIEENINLDTALH